MTVSNQAVLRGGLQLGSTTAVNQILNESDLSSNSAEALPTQASVKSYVDTNALSASGTPADNQLAVWVDASTLEGSTAASVATNSLKFVRDDAPSNMTAMAYSTNDTNVASHYVIRGRGSAASPLGVQSGDVLGTFKFGAYYSASNIADGALIQAEAVETWAVGEYGTDLTFQTVAIDSGTLTERMRISSGGYVRIGTDALTHLSPSVGNVMVSGGLEVHDTSYLDDRLVITTDAVADTGTLEIAMTSSGSWNWAAEMMCSSMTAGQNIVHFIGKSGNAKNAGYFGFNWQGAASNDNFITFGLHSVDNIFNLTGAGFVGLNTTSPDCGLQLGAGTSTHSLSATNDCFFTGNLEVDGTIHADAEIEIGDITAPSPTTNKLYSVSGALYWDGTQLDVGGPGGSSPQMQYNTGSGFGGATNVRYDNTNSALIVGAEDSILWTGAPSLFVIGENNHGYHAITCSSNTSTHYPILVMSRSNGTASNPTATVSGDTIGRFMVGGVTGSSWTSRVTGGEIRFVAAENYATNPGTDYRLYMVQSGSSTLAKRYEIDGANGDHIWYGSGTTPTENMQLFGSGNNEGCLTLNTDGGQTYNGLFVYTASSTAGNRANITLSRSRGTNSSPTAISDGDIIGELSIDGCHEADNYVAAAYIRATATGNWTSSSYPAEVTIWTNPGSAGYSSPVLTLADSGYVGIKESSPIYGLHITGGDNRADSSVVMENFTGTGGGGPLLNFRSARGTAGTPTAVQDGHNLFYIVGTGYNGTDYKSGALIQALAEETWDGTGNGASLYFFTVTTNTTSLTYRLRILHDGRIYMPAVYGDTVTSARDLEIQSDGKIGYVSSATRYKENVQAYTDASWIHDLPVKTFTYIADAPGGDTHYGFLAEDLEELNSDLVFYEDSLIEGIHYKRMIPVAVRAIQELKIETDVYGDRLDALDIRYVPETGGGHTWYDAAETPTKVLEVTDGGSLYAYGTYDDPVGGTNRELYIDDSGKIGYLSSALRYKKYVNEIKDTEFLNDLRPVTFKFKKDLGGGEKQYGLIAEEVEEVNSDFVFYDEDSRVEGVHYKKFIPVLIKANQEQRETADELASMVESLESQIVDLQKKLNELSGKDRTRPKL